MLRYLGLQPGGRWGSSTPRAQPGGEAFGGAFTVALTVVRPARFGVPDRHRGVFSLGGSEDGGDRLAAGRRDVRERTDQPFWRRSTNRPIARWLHSWRPQSSRFTPVAIMISSRAGRSFSSAFRERILGRARGRPLGRALSLSTATMSPLARDRVALHDVAVVVESGAEVMGEVGARVAAQCECRLHCAVLRESGEWEWRLSLPPERRPPSRSRPNPPARWCAPVRGCRHTAVSMSTTTVEAHSLGIGALLRYPRHAYPDLPT